MILISLEILTPDRGSEFKIVDHTKVPRPRMVGPLTSMSYQVFTMEGTSISEPSEIQAPHEITLSQLVTYFILPTGIQLDVDSTFYWNLRRFEDKTEKDKTKWKVEQIPIPIPSGFNLRVKCNTLHDHSTKKMARVRFGSYSMSFAMPEDAILERLKERVADWMNRSGQGPDWTVDGSNQEAIDFSFEYEVIPVEREVPVRIFLKQTELEVMPS
jgi:hypothetical protein